MKRALFLLAALAFVPQLARADTSPPRITHTPIEKAPLGAAILVKCEIVDESPIFAPSLLVRAKGTKEFDTIDLKKTTSTTYEATIPAEQVTGDLEYVIEAFDEIGNGPARAGSPEQPLPIKTYDPKSAPAVPPPVVVVTEGDPAVVPPAEGAATSSGGLHTKWWFWTLLAGAAAGGVVAVVVATSGGAPSAVDLQITGPDPTLGQ